MVISVTTHESKFIAMLEKDNVKNTIYILRSANGLCVSLISSDVMQVVFPQLRNGSYYLHIYSLSKILCTKAYQHVERII